MCKRNTQSRTRITVRFNENTAYSVAVLARVLPTMSLAHRLRGIDAVSLLTAMDLVCVSTSMSAEGRWMAPWSAVVDAKAASRIADAAVPVSMAEACLHASMADAAMASAATCASTASASVHVSTADASVHASAASASVHVSTAEASVHASMAEASVHASMASAAVHASTADAAVASAAAPASTADGRRCGARLDASAHASTDDAAARDVGPTKEKGRRRRTTAPKRRRLLYTPLEALCGDFDFEVWCGNCNAGETLTVPCAGTSGSTYGPKCRSCGNIFTDVF